MSPRPDDSPFLKRVLIPFWIIRIIILLLDVLGCALLIAVFASPSYHFSDYNVSSSTAIAILAVELAIVSTLLILDIACIVKRSRHTLTPAFFLGVNIGQTIMWTVHLGLTADLGASTLSIAISVIVFLSCVALLIYGSVVYHRYRKGRLPSQKADLQMTNNA